MPGSADEDRWPAWWRQSGGAFQDLGHARPCQMRNARCRMQDARCRASSPSHRVCIACSPRASPIRWDAGWRGAAKGILVAVFGGGALGMMDLVNLAGTAVRHRICRGPLESGPAMGNTDCSSSLANVAHGLPIWHAGPGGSTLVASRRTPLSSTGILGQPTTQARGIEYRVRVVCFGTGRPTARSAGTLAILQS
jgi:hypothetical protein